MGIQTDLGTTGIPGGTSGWRTGSQGLKGMLGRLLGFPDSFVSYDPDVQKLRSSGPFGAVKMLHTGPHGFPTMTPEALDSLKQIRQTPRNDLISELLQTQEMPAHVRQQLGNLGGLRLLAITGSGRGDQVASRALDLHQKLQAAGLGDKWKIMAMLGDSAKTNPLAQQVQAHPDILGFGKLPQKFYIGLPGLSDFHDASSGTSALMEALGTPAHLNFHPDQNALKGEELRALGNFGHVDPAKGDWRLKDIVPHPSVWGGNSDAAKHMEGIQNVNLDEWNKGNKAFAWRFPGVSNAQSSDDIVKLLQGEQTFSPAATALRAARADHMISAHGAAREALQGHLLDWLRERRQFLNLKGVGKLTGAAGLASAALAPLLMRRAQPLQPNSNQPV